MKGRRITMMIQCEKCKEFIGEEKASCPFCRHEVSKKYLEEQKEKILLEHFEAEQRAIEAYQKTVFYARISWVAFIVLILLGVWINSQLDENSSFFMIYIVVVCVANIIVRNKLKSGACPYCERFMGRLHLLYANCPHCGGRLK